MPAQCKLTYPAVNLAEGNKRRFWLTALTIGESSPLTGTYAPLTGTCGFGYYYFAEAWPALLRAGSG